MAAKKKLKASKKKAEKKAKSGVKAGIKANVTAKTRTAKNGATHATAGKAAGSDPKRVAAILAKLDEAYPEATCELKHESPFQLVISTILSAQCTDVRVNQVTESLYQKYRKPEDFAYANPAELEAEIRPTGFFRSKTKSVIGASKAIVEKFGG